MAVTTRSDAIVRHRPAAPGYYVEWPLATMPEKGGLLYTNLGPYTVTSFGGKFLRRGVEHIVIHVKPADSK